MIAKTSKQSAVSSKQGCGKPCAHAFFFGGQDDVEDETDLAKLEDGE